MKGGVRAAGDALARSLVLVAAIALVACAGSGKKTDIPDRHVVRAGATLYSISMRYGLDYHDVALEAYRDVFMAVPKAPPGSNPAKGCVVIRPQTISATATSRYSASSRL